MEKKVFSIKKVLLIVSFTFAAVAGTAASATALSTKQSNVIPNLHNMCSTVAEKVSANQSWMSAYSDCVSAHSATLKR